MTSYVDSLTNQAWQGFIKCSFAGATNNLTIYQCLMLKCLGDDTDSLFMVSSTGVVSAVGILDRETLDFYMINVAVSHIVFINISIRKALQTSTVHAGYVDAGYIFSTGFVQKYSVNRTEVGGRGELMAIIVHIQFEDAPLIVCNYKYIL